MKHDRLRKRLTTLSYLAQETRRPSADIRSFQVWRAFSTSTLMAIMSTHVSEMTNVENESYQEGRAAGIKEALQLVDSLMEVEDGEHLDEIRGRLTASGSNTLDYWEAEREDLRAEVEAANA